MVIKKKDFLYESFYLFNKLKKISLVINFLSLFDGSQVSLFWEWKMTGWAILKLNFRLVDYKSIISDGLKKICEKQCHKNREDKFGHQSTIWFGQSSSEQGRRKGFLELNSGALSTRAD